MSHETKDGTVIDSYYVLEYPAWVHNDKSPLAAAKRELLEENGYTGDFTMVGVTTPNPATHTNSIYTFLITNPSKISEPQADSTEEITAEFITPKQLWKLIDQGKFSQALYISSLILALRKFRQ